jgi:hypothetical protein
MNARIIASIIAISSTVAFADMGFFFPLGSEIQNIYQFTHSENSGDTTLIGVDTVQLAIKISDSLIQVTHSSYFDTCKLSNGAVCTKNTYHLYPFPTSQYSYGITSIDSIVDGNDKYLLYDSTFINPPGLCLHHVELYEYNIGPVYESTYSSSGLRGTYFDQSSVYSISGRLCNGIEIYSRIKGKLTSIEVKKPLQISYQPFSPLAWAYMNHNILGRIARKTSN